MATILIADDHPDLRKLLEIQFTQKGFTCQLATNGLEAIQLLETQSVDLMIMDLNMPELDGWQAAAAIRAQAPTRAIPIIALTAYSLEGDRARALNAGCNAFFTKPVVFEELLAEVHRLLSEIAA